MGIHHHHTPGNADDDNDDDFYNDGGNNDLDDVEIALKNIGASTSSNIKCKKGNRICFLNYSILQLILNYSGLKANRLRDRSNTSFQ